MLEHGSLHRQWRGRACEREHYPGGADQRCGAVRGWECEGVSV